jgi:hypothetical protein
VLQQSNKKYPVLQRFRYSKRKHEDSTDEFKDQVQGESDNSKRQKDEPKNRQQKNKSQRKGPAQNEQNTPENYANHCFHVLIFATINQKINQRKKPIYC